MKSQCRRGRLLASLPLLALAACAAGETEQPVDTAKPAPPEVDPRALCEVVTSVEDARARGAIDALSKSLQERVRKKPADRAAVFGSLYAIVDEEERWKAFKADRAAHPESAVGPLGECFTYASWKMADQARFPCDGAAEKLPGLALVDVARGDLARGQGDEGGARERYEAALATDAGCTPALIRLARLEAASDPAAGLATYERAVSSSPACFVCAFEKADLLEKSQGGEAALSAWEAALALAPEHATTVKRYAAAQAGRDDAAALAAYEKALSLGVNDPATLLAAARLSQKTGDGKKALAHARAAAKAQPDDAATWRLVATLASAAGDAEGVASANAEVLRLLPDDAAAHLALARSDTKAERWVEALLHYEEALETLPPEHEDKKAAEQELGELRGKLFIRKDGLKGNVNRVVANVQADVKKLFEQQKKKQKGLSGLVEITVLTAEDGSVQDVSIAKDTLGDSQVAASLVGNLKRATIVGGAKRYNFELEFQ